MKKIAITLIKYYQYFSKNQDMPSIVPLVFHSSCKFYPSCSDYAIEAIEHYGFLKGMAKTSYRIARCNPLSTFSVDNP